MRDFHLPGRSSVLANGGMCATSHPLAAKVAVDTLQKGGNAVDAALAGALLLGICEPQATGIGGDLFALIAPAPDGPVISINGSGRAPAALRAQSLRDEGYTAMPEYDARAVTIPGAIDAVCRLSEDHGRLGLADVLAPTIHYADTGVPVAPRVAFDWQANLSALQPSGLQHYADQGAALSLGQTFRAPGQAEILRRVAKEGRSGFYEGEVAEDIVTTLQSLGGSHTLDDFAKNAPTYTTAVSVSYRALELLEHPPNGQGATALLMLAILEHFDIAGMDPWGAERVHIEAEAAKLAYDARDRFVADTDYATRVEHMLRPETAASLAALIDPASAMESPAARSESVHKDTVYITVVDKDRMAVSLIYSIFHAFGSGIASEKFGVLLQNRGAGFTLEEGHPNEAAGGKRPLHTIIPALLRKGGRVAASFGVMGGAYQPNGHARVVTNTLDYGLDPQTALDGPRAFSEDGTLKVERGYGDDVRQALADKGHHVMVPETPIGGAQAIFLSEDGTLEGASDPRKDGCAIGY